MISLVRPSFWRAYERLAPAVKARARLAYQLFAENPEHPSLRFKKLQGGGEIWSVRITDQFQLTQEQYGDMEFVFGVAFAIGAITFGSIADRVSVRWLYPCVLIAWSATGFATGLTS